jgi:hypothetical protein
MSDGPEWFGPKRYGYGAGLPISWQGWALTSAFVILVVGLGLLLVNRLPVFFAALIPLTMIFILITARTTKGGWRWRWGDKETD